MSAVGGNCDSKGRIATLRPPSCMCESDARKLLLGFMQGLLSAFLVSDVT